MATNTVDPLKDIERALGLIIRRHPGDFRELRGLEIPNGRYRPFTKAGWFSDIKLMAAEAARLDHLGGKVYFTLNPAFPELSARAENKTVVAGPGFLTNDNQILRLEWLFLDVDANNPHNVSRIAATDEEHAAALAGLRRIRELLMTEMNWPMPIVVDSGNGGYLWFGIDLERTPENIALVARVQTALAHKFNDGNIEIDCKVFNPSRLARIPGTVNRKGDNTKTRFHRRSQILEAPATEQIEIVTREQLEQVAALAPTENAASKKTSSGASADSGAVKEAKTSPGLEEVFDVLKEQHGITASEPKRYKDSGWQCFLSACVFNPGHSGGTGVSIIEYDSGHKQYSCMHEPECRENNKNKRLWADVLVKLGLGESQEHRTAANTHASRGEQREHLQLADFYAYMPKHQYIFAPSCDLWPAKSVNARLSAVPLTHKDGSPILDEDGNKKMISPSSWLDSHAPVEQMTWAPGEPMIIDGRLIAEGGWIGRADVRCFNLYRAPTLAEGDSGQAGPWLAHVHKIYPDDAEHILNWLAHRVQFPHRKINHALVLGGAQGIGKDTLIEPVKRAVGPWNVHDVCPRTILDSAFNGFMKAVILCISEARDLGENDRFAFYDHMKSIIAAPPNVVRVNEKHLHEYYIPNVCGVIVTTNHKSDGIYLPPDDRRHFVAWSSCQKENFDANYWVELWRYYNNGGDGHILAYLAQRDLSAFNANAPPPETPAFWDVVSASRSPEDAELADVIDRLNNPDVVTLAELISTAGQTDFGGWLKDRKNRRRIPHRLESCGYVSVQNPDAKDGLWKLRGARQAVYGRTELSLAERLKAVRSHGVGQ